MLIFVVLLLVAAGLVILYSTSAYNGQVKFHDPFHYLKKQGFATLLGLFGMALIARVDYHKWVPLAIPAYVTSIILSVAVIFFGDEYNGSKRWLSLGPISFQPSEFAKVAVIFFLACLVSRNVQRMKRFRTMILMMIPVLPIVGLVGASNLSTAIIILGIAVVLIFVADQNILYKIITVFHCTALDHINQETSADNINTTGNGIGACLNRLLFKLFDPAFLVHLDGTEPLYVYICRHVLADNGHIRFFGNMIFEDFVVVHLVYTIAGGNNYIGLMAVF